MRLIARVLGLGVVAVFVAQLGLGCGGAQVVVGGPAPVGRANCATACAQMASCPKGATCLQACNSAQSLSVEAACEGSLQAELDCVSTQQDVCGASQGACRTQTMALGACITNYCTKQRMGSPNQALCLQAAVGF